MTTPTPPATPFTISLATPTSTPSPLLSITVSPPTGSSAFAELKVDESQKTDRTFRSRAPSLSVSASPRLPEHDLTPLETSAQKGDAASAAATFKLAFFKEQLGEFEAAKELYALATPPGRKE
jgi:hypothetical protein